MTSVTNVHINPLNFTLVSLALLSLVRSAAISMSVSQFSSLVELCSLKTVYPAVVSLLDLTASVWYTKCLCTAVLPL